MKPPLLALLCLAAAGCGATQHDALTPRASRAAAEPRVVWEEGATPTMPPPPVAPPPAATPPDPWGDPMGALTRASQHASPGARRVLDAAKAMIDGGVVTRGSCFTWVNAVYRRAGGQRQTVFEGDRRTRWAEASQLRPGDWVFFINHSFGDVTHSAIFVAWVDEPRRVALMVSYPGGNRDAPGRFSDYALTNVYQLVRMRDG
ncbi:MAG: hypothetical protein U0324_39150 [Polyangiales bacterium]